jgi:hypothetical protein
MLSMLEMGCRVTGVEPTTLAVAIATGALTERHLRHLTEEPVGDHPP